jgi:hypothetical protein
MRRFVRQAAPWVAAWLAPGVGLAWVYWAAGVSPGWGLLWGWLGVLGAGAHRVMARANRRDDVLALARALELSQRPTVWDGPTTDERTRT